MWIRRPTNPPSAGILTRPPTYSEMHRPRVASHTLRIRLKSVAGALKHDENLPQASYVRSFGSTTPLGSEHFLNLHHHRLLPPPRARGLEP